MPQLTPEEQKEAVQLARDINDRSCVGCCLHIVLDDENVDNHSIEFSIRIATERNCQECVRLGQLMLKMKKTQRKKMGSYR